MPKHLFAQLDDEWRDFVHSRRALDAIARWSTDPALRPFLTLDDLIGFTSEREHPDTTNDVLFALVTRACHDVVAARTVLQCLVPGLRRVSADRAWSADGADVDALVVALAWEAIRMYPVDRRPRAVAANIIRDTQMHFRRSGITRCRTEVPTSALTGVSTRLQESTVDSVTSVVCAAVAARRISSDDARLILLTRVLDVPIRALVGGDGRTAGALRQARRRAESKVAAALGHWHRSMVDSS